MFENQAEILENLKDLYSNLNTMYDSLELQIADLEQNYIIKSEKIYKDDLEKTLSIKRQRI